MSAIICVRVEQEKTPLHSGGRGELDSAAAVPSQARRWRGVWVGKDIYLACHAFPIMAFFSAYDAFPGSLTFCLF